MDCSREIQIEIRKLEPVSTAFIYTFTLAFTTMHGPTVECHQLSLLQEPAVVGKQVASIQHTI